MGRFISGVDMMLDIRGGIAGEGVAMVWVEEWLSRFLKSMLFVSEVSPRRDSLSRVRLLVHGYTQVLMVSLFGLQGVDLIAPESRLVFVSGCLDRDWSQ